MILQKLFDVVTDFQNRFRDHQVLLINPQPIPKPNVIMLGLTSFEAPNTVWGASRKRAILTVVASKQLDFGKGAEYDVFVQEIASALRRFFDIVELRDLDFLSLPTQKLLFIYLGFEVQWI